MATLAKLVVQISGNTKRLHAAIGKAETRLKKLRKVGGKALGGLQKAAKGLAIGGGVAVAGFAVAAIKNFLDTGEALDKMSKRTGFSVESLSELKFAAEQSGTSLETVEKGAKRMASVIYDAELGLSSATDALDGLGVNLADSSGYDTRATV